MNARFVSRRFRTGTPRTDEQGTTIPLILGFFIVALLMVAGSIAASDAALDQRNLQHVCDGAALAGANALDSDRVFDGELGARASLPIGTAAESAVADYLQRDSQRSDVRIESAALTV